MAGCSASDCRVAGTLAGLLWQLPCASDLSSTCSVSGTYNMIAGKPNGAGAEDSLALWYQGGSLLAGAALNSTSNAAANPWTATPGEWHHAAVTYDHTAQVASLYVDGALTACSTNTAPTYDTHAMLLGADNDNGTEQGYWDGLLDETTADSSGAGNTGTLGSTGSAEATDPAWVTSAVPY